MTVSVSFIVACGFFAASLISLPFVIRALKTGSDKPLAGSSKAAVLVAVAAPPLAACAFLVGMYQQIGGTTYPVQMDARSTLPSHAVGTAPLVSSASASQ